MAQCHLVRRWVSCGGVIWGAAMLRRRMYCGSVDVMWRCPLGSVMWTEEVSSGGVSCEGDVMSKVFHLEGGVMWRVVSQGVGDFMWKGVSCIRVIWRMGGVMWKCHL